MALGLGFLVRLWDRVPVFLALVAVVTSSVRQVIVCDRVLR